MPACVHRSAGTKACLESFGRVEAELQVVCADVPMVLLLLKAPLPGQDMRRVSSCEPTNRLSDAKPVNG